VRNQEADDSWRGWRCRGSVADEVRQDVVLRWWNPGKSPSQSLNCGFRVGFLPVHGAPNQRMKLDVAAAA
jgi:hypothetical protein